MMNIDCTMKGAWTFMASLGPVMSVYLHSEEPTPSTHLREEHNCVWLWRTQRPLKKQYFPLKAPGNTEPKKLIWKKLTEIHFCSIWNLMFLLICTFQLKQLYGSFRGISGSIYPLMGKINLLTSSQNILLSNILR